MYETPHTAIVILTYTPDTGFSGDDNITFSVTDIDGAISTAQIQIKVGVSPEVGLHRVHYQYRRRLSDWIIPHAGYRHLVDGLLHRP